jgi:GNAT superfamily N-acetyltransferase
MAPLDVVADPAPAAIRPLLARDPILTAYLLGDLAPGTFERCRWYLATWRERAVAAVMVYLGLRTPAVLSYGAPDGIAAIFEARRAEWPGECWAKIPAEHEASYRDVFDIARAEPTWIMGLSAADYQPPPPGVTVVRLGPDDPIEPILALYAEYPANFFEPSLLARDLYFGAVDETGRLAAVAGTHSRSLEDGVAVVGNIVTRREARNRGYARACTARLVEAHLAEGCRQVALHVAADNAPAIRAYRALGFAYRGLVSQAWCRRTRGRE